MNNSELSILQPILSDKVLMALMRFKYVPLAFILQRCNLAFNQKNAIDVINEFGTLEDGKTADGDDFSTSFVKIKPQFQMIKKAVHISTGIEGSVKANMVLVASEVVEMLTKKVISINTLARDISSDFNNKIYKPFSKQVEQYEKILRDCERQTNIVPVLEKHGMTADDWRRLKSAISRFGINRDIHFATEILIDGALIHELQRKFMGKSVPDVVCQLLRESLSTN